MTDGEALFRAICEQPHEDTPRLMYADWLQESGQPERAEFIRLQCEERALSPASPTLSATRTRASELEKAFRDRWDAELPAVPGLEWGDIYVRGFVDTVRAVYFPDVRTSLLQAFAAAPLQILTVVTLRHGQLRELLAFPLLGRLAKLSLPGISGNEEARVLTAAYKRFPNTEIIN